MSVGCNTEALTLTLKDSWIAKDESRDWLETARYIVAPMVNQSDVVWRMLIRRYHPSSIVYTQMILAQTFLDDAHYRQHVTSYIHASHSLALSLELSFMRVFSHIILSECIAHIYPLKSVRVCDV